MMEGEEIFASDGQDNLNYLRSAGLVISARPSPPVWDLIPTFLPPLPCPPSHVTMG